MTDREFLVNSPLYESGHLPLNETLLLWHSIRSSSNKAFCKEWVLACGKIWNSTSPDADLFCEYEASIQTFCPPWDYELFLDGMNGTVPIRYVRVNGGKSSSGGLPYLQSIDEEVLINWAQSMDPLNVLFTKFNTRYALSVGYSYSAELLCIMGFSFFAFTTVFFSDICQLMDQIGLSHIIEHGVENPNMVDLVLGDIYLALRIIGTASLCFVSAMLLVNAKGVQAVLSGCLSLAFFVNFDDAIFKSLNDNFMMSKTKVYVGFMHPTFKEARNWDQTPIVLFDSVAKKLNLPDISSDKLFYGRYRGVLAALMTGGLWLRSINAALGCAVGETNPSELFDIYNGFYQVGVVIVGMLPLIVAATAPKGGWKSAIASFRLVVAVLWVFVLSWKIILWGILFWSSDVVLYRQCSSDKDVCESIRSVVSRVFSDQFMLVSRATLQLNHPEFPVTYNEWFQSNNMLVAMYVSIAIHAVVVISPKVSRCFIIKKTSPAVYAA